MKHKVLLVDDELNVTEGLKRSLRNEPYEVLTTNSPQEALKHLAESAIDVIISDENMPGMSGSNLITVVRKRYPDVIRMILTGHANLEAIIRAINQGEVYRFFTKPCNAVDLAITIRQALQQKDLMIEIRRLLKASRRQLSTLEELEKQHPGITKVNLDAGRIVIDDAEGDYETLIKQLRTEVHRHEKFNDQ